MPNQQTNKPTNQQTLTDLHEIHQGKISEKWHLYLEVYDRIFATYRHQPIHLLEIGVQNGGSMEIWTRYFPKAKTLIGCDINPACGQLQYDDARVHICIGDANQVDTQTQILSFAPAFDIIIDDGSHHSADIIRTFALYFDHLKDGGVMVIEDLHCSYWTNYLGGLNQHFSSMNFLKQLADIINFEHWRAPLERAAILQDYWQAFQCVAPAHLAHIHSVEFVNSMCIIRKRVPQENELGQLNASGREAAVSVHPWHGQAEKITIDVIAPPKDAPASFMSGFMENQLLRQHIQMLEQQNQQLRGALQQIQAVLQQTGSGL